MTEQTPEQPKDRKELKIQALLEKIANTVAKYENELADNRVEYTILVEEYNRTLTALQEVHAREAEREVPKQEESGADDTD